MDSQTLGGGGCGQSQGKSRGSASVLSALLSSSSAAHGLGGGRLENGAWQHEFRVPVPPVPGQVMPSPTSLVTPEPAARRNRNGNGNARVRESGHENMAGGQQQQQATFSPGYLGLDSHSNSYEQENGDRDQDHELVASISRPRSKSQGTSSKKKMKNVTCGKKNCLNKEGSILRAPRKTTPNRARVGSKHEDKHDKNGKQVEANNDGAEAGGSGAKAKASPVPESSSSSSELLRY